LGELGTIHRYSYWSDRRVADLAGDNAIDLRGGRWQLGFSTPALGFLPQVQATQNRKALLRHEVATKIEDSIGKIAVENFVTPPPATFVKGCTDVTFAAYTRWHGAKKDAKRRAVIIHGRTTSSSGTRVEICLFASIEHCAGYLVGSEAEAPMWSSSSTGIIEEFIANKGKRPAGLYDDDESISVEILRTIFNQGMLGKSVFKRLHSAEWFAEVYKDVELEKGRWNLRVGSDIAEPVDRIVIGAPLWVRSSTG
jgi:hypothetical protein